jgi:hypothetical protein
VGISSEDAEFDPAHEVTIYPSRKIIKTEDGSYWYADIINAISWCEENCKNRWFQTYRFFLLSQAMMLLCSN